MNVTRYKQMRSLSQSEHCTPLFLHNLELGNPCDLLSQSDQIDQTVTPYLRETIASNSMEVLIPSLCCLGIVQLLQQVGLSALGFHHVSHVDGPLLGVVAQNSHKTMVEHGRTV